VTTGSTIQERGSDRRRSRRFVVHERRSGFERRTPRRYSSLGAAYEGSLVYLRDHPGALVVLLVLANVLSLFDFLLTLVSLRLGFAESNPVMDYFFRGSVAQAGIVKCGLVAVVALALWSLRRYRAALVTAVFLAGLYVAIVLYEVAALAHLA
jgi:hypothetical protein